MNLINRTANALFDLALVPFEAVGAEFSLVMTSGIFGVLALIAFKHISWQKGIKGTKDRIKGHLIEIRIYQDDLVVVAASVCKILMRNFQYMALNFGPFVPLAIPFVLVAAQMVTRYGFAPVQLQDPAALTLAGQGNLLQIEMAPGHEAEVSELEVLLPEGLRAVSPVVRTRTDGRAFQEFVAVDSGGWDVIIKLGDGTQVTKRIFTGDVEARALQPERVSSFWSAWLWPAEDTLAASPALAHVSFTYPERELAYMPDGPFGVLLALLVASMAFGAAVMKPLGVQI